MKDRSLSYHVLEAALLGAASTAGMYAFIVAMQPDNKAKIKAIGKSVWKTLTNPDGAIKPADVV